MQMEAILHVDHTCTGLRDCSLLISLVFLAFQDLSIPFPNAAGPSQTQQVCQRGINVRALKPSIDGSKATPRISKLFIFGKPFWVLSSQKKPKKLFKLTCQIKLSGWIPSILHHYCLSWPAAEHAIPAIPIFSMVLFWWFLMFLFSRNCDSLWHSVTSTESDSGTNPT